jgi:hypothetical protein
MSDIDVSGIDHAALLAALHNGTKPLGLGALHDMGRDMTVEEAQTILDEQNGKFDFDYLKGRPLKVWIENDGVTLCRSDLYDRDTRPGACAAIVASLKGS